MKRHRHLDLLSLNQPREIRVNQTALDRIDLSIVKHHFTRAQTFDVDREDRVSSGFRAKDRGEFTKRSDGGDSFRATAINRNGHHALAPRAPRIILAATFTHLCLHLVIFFLRHDFSLTNFQRPGLA